MKQSFTIGIFTENNAGSIVRIVTMISRRRIHIESLEVCSSAGENIYGIVLAVSETEDTINKLFLQIDKQVEVFKTFFDTNEAMVREAMGSYFYKNFPEARHLTQQAIAEESII